jgi:hypothetical protein
MNSKRDKPGPPKAVVSPEEDSYTCEACGMSFSNEDQFNRHREQEDGASPSPEDIQ